MFLLKVMVNGETNDFNNCIGEVRVATLAVLRHTIHDGFYICIIAFLQMLAIKTNMGSVDHSLMLSV